MKEVGKTNGQNTEHLAYGSILSHAGLLPHKIPSLVKSLGAKQRSFFRKIEWVNRLICHDMEEGSYILNLYGESVRQLGSIEPFCWNCVACSARAESDCRAGSESQ